MLNALMSRHEYLATALQTAAAARKKAVAERKKKAKKTGKVRCVTAWRDDECVSKAQALFAVVRHRCVLTVPSPRSQP